MSSVDFLELPEDCLSHILSLTSPIDVLRSSAVSKHFLRVSESDAVWEKFLPSDCYDIISRSSNPFQLPSSKKDLFLHLVRSPILLNNNTQVFNFALLIGDIWVLIVFCCQFIDYGQVCKILRNLLLNFYVRCGHIDYGQKQFDKIPQRNLVRRWLIKKNPYDNLILLFFCILIVFLVSSLIITIYKYI